MWKSGNEVISCFPKADTQVHQHEWTGFVCAFLSFLLVLQSMYQTFRKLFLGNSRRPEITQTNLVDIYLFHGDSHEQIRRFHNVPNPIDQSGFITALVNDSWFGEMGNSWNNKNVSYPFYWVLTRSDKELDGSEIPQTTFSAVRKYSNTCFVRSVLTLAT